MEVVAHLLGRLEGKERGHGIIVVVTTIALTFQGQESWMYATEIALWA